MKIIYIFAASALLLSGCKPETQTDATLAVPVTAETEIIEEHPEETAALLHGLWMSESYLSGIEKTRSIYRNRDYKTTILGFNLYKDSLINGTGALHGFSDHEGGYYWPLKFNPATKKFDYDASRGQKHDTPLKLSVYSTGKDKLEIEYANPYKKERFRKISESDDTYAFKEELNRILFEGSYTDSITGKEVVFKRNGQMEGIGENLQYSLVFDFEGLTFDTVYMWIEELEGEEDMYHYKIKGNTILLYPITGNFEIMDYQVAEKPSYILHKK